MKTLRAFWHWVDNEKPDTSRFNEAAEENLSSNAHAGLHFALCSVDSRAGCTFTSADRTPVMGAIRELSLEVCRALDEMCDLVEEDCLAGEPAAVHEQTFICNMNLDFRGMSVSFDLPKLEMLNTGTTAAVLVGSDGTRTRLPPGEPTPVPLCSHTDYHLEPERGDHATPLRDDTALAQRMFDQQRAMNDQMFKREYVGDWLPLSSGQLAEFSSGQLANMHGRVLGQLANDDGLKLLRPADDYEVKLPRTIVGQLRSFYEEGKLTIFTTVTVDELNQFRGLAPRSIIILGEPTDYGPNALAYLPDVIAPMLDRAVINTPDPAMARWCKGKLWP